MFGINDTVQYGTNGVCRITDVVTKNFGGDCIRYYVLEPVHQAHSVVYVLVKNERLVAKMKKLLSEQKVETLVQKIPQCRIEWIEDDSLRQETYKAILAKGERRELLGLIRVLYSRQQTLKERHRHLRTADKQVLKTAEKLINDEFAAVLHISLDEVVPFIMNKLERSEKTYKYAEVCYVPRIGADFLR